MAFFISSNMRKCINEGRGDAVPIFLHDIPYVFERNVIPVDVSIISVRKSDFYLNTPSAVTLSIFTITIHCHLIIIYNRYKIFNQ